VAELTVFELLFETLPDGDFTPRLWIQIEVTKFGPGAAFGTDFKPGGYPISEWRGRRICGHREGHVLVVDAVSKSEIA
jgi:hypothetical protein